MGEKDGVIHRSDPTRGGKPGVSDLIVVDEIGGKENRRGDERGHHAGDVGAFFLTRDEPPACEKKGRTERVEARVEGWEVLQRHGLRRRISACWRLTF